MVIRKAYVFDIEKRNILIDKIVFACVVFTFYLLILIGFGIESFTTPIEKFKGDRILIFYALFGFIALYMTLIRRNFYFSLIFPIFLSLTYYFLFFDELSIIVIFIFLVLLGIFTNLPILLHKLNALFQEWEKHGVRIQHNKTNPSTDIITLPPPTQQILFRGVIFVLVVSLVVATYYLVDHYGTIFLLPIIILLRASSKR